MVELRPWRSLARPGRLSESGRGASRRDRPSRLECSPSGSGPLCGEADVRRRWDWPAPDIKCRLLLKNTGTTRLAPKHSLHQSGSTVDTKRSPQRSRHSVFTRPLGKWKPDAALTHQPAEVASGVTAGGAACVIGPGHTLIAVLNIVSARLTISSSPQRFCSRTNRLSSM